MTPAFADTMGVTTLETIPTFPFLVAGYITFFVILFIYIVTLHSRQRKLARDVEALERRAGSQS